MPPDMLAPALTVLLDPLAEDPPRASAFIVTLYGDVVEPRGGRLWMGTLIDCCAGHGISESLVRTAVSRLVSAGRLEGDRIGRRSHYRLAAAARAEFGAAAQVLYTPPPAPQGWLLAPADQPPGPGWAALGGVALAPNRSDMPRPAGLVWSADVVSGVADLPGLAAALWPVAEVGTAYAAFVARFAPLLDQCRSDPPDAARALALRLRLVHDYRLAALADPRLPQAALPADWPGPAARRLFVTLYLTLAEAADACIGSRFPDPDGLLPQATAATDLRLDRLRREAARPSD